MLFCTAGEHSRLNSVARAKLSRGLPRRQSRVLTWPLITVFGFIAEPGTHIFLKPTVLPWLPENMVSIFTIVPDRHGERTPVFSRLPMRSDAIFVSFALETSSTFSLSFGSWDQMSTKSSQVFDENLAKLVQNSLRLFSESCQIEPRRISRIGVKAILHEVE
jgi:hypothetical protein